MIHSHAVILFGYDTTNARRRVLTDVVGALQVVIRAGSATIGKVDQGAPGSDPWLVRERNWLVSKSAAREQSREVKTSSGSLRSVAGRVDADLAAGSYYLQVLDAPSLPADGAVTHLVAPIKLQKITGADYNFSVDLLSCGVSFAAGCFVVLSSTEFTKTLVTAGSNLVVTARYV